MVSLDDQQNFASSESMDRLVGTADVSEHRQPVGIVVEQDWVVRSHQLSVVAADQDAPRVLPDQSTDDLGILCRVNRIVAHKHYCAMVPRLRELIAMNTGAAR
jgi:hypothetical protein